MKIHIVGVGFKCPNIFDLTRSKKTKKEIEGNLFTKICFVVHPLDERL